MRLIRLLFVIANEEIFISISLKCPFKNAELSFQQQEEDNYSPSNVDFVNCVFNPLVLLLSELK